jgi:hypothetical protein
MREDESKGGGRERVSWLKMTGARRRERQANGKERTDRIR